MARNKSSILSAQELSAFFGQLAFIIKAGIPLDEGLRMMADESTDNTLSGLIQAMVPEIELGKTLSDALEEAGVFPAYSVQMLRIGEEAGRTEEVLGSLSSYYEQNAAIRSSIRTAITYPAIIIAMMAVVIFVLIVKVLPIFNDIFRQLGGEMSGFAQGIMNFGQAISNSAIYILIAAVVIVVACLILRKTPAGKRFFSWLFSAMFKKTNYLIFASRFASAMSMLLASGIDTDRAIEMVGGLMTNKKDKARITQVQQLMNDGMAFPAAVNEAGVFTGLQAHMIAVGFKSGSVDTVLERLATQYAYSAQNKINNLVSIIEPVLVAVLSVIIGMILLSVMLPLMGIMSAIG